MFNNLLSVFMFLVLNKISVVLNGPFTLRCSASMLVSDEISILFLMSFSSKLSGALFMHNHGRRFSVSPAKWMYRSVPNLSVL